MTHVAIGPAGTTQVQILGRIKKFSENESIEFYCVNGAWSGIIWPDGSMMVKETGSMHSGLAILWRGESNEQYNEEIPRIMHELRAAP